MYLFLFFFEFWGFHANFSKLFSIIALNRVWNITQMSKKPNPFHVVQNHNFTPHTNFWQVFDCAIESPRRNGFFIFLCIALLSSEKMKLSIDFTKAEGKSSPKKYHQKCYFASNIVLIYCEKNMLTGKNVFEIWDHYTKNSSI